MHRHLLTGVLALLLTPAAAAEERIEATYEVLWGGLEIGRFVARVRAGEVDYRVAYRAETTGFLGWLFPFVSEGASEGALGGTAPRPARFNGESRRRDGASAWLVEFTPDGEASRVEVNNSIDEQRDPVPQALRRAPDPLALALHATDRIAPGARFIETGFDGKRSVRFELDCEPVEHRVDMVAGVETLGSALRCALDGGVEAGRSRRWEDGRDEAREPAKILLSRELVAERYWPVRVEAPTRFGRVIARLVELR